MKYHRRKFLQTGSVLALGATIYPSFSCRGTAGHIVTVNGNIAPDDLGLTLAHEHIMVDFIGADQIRPGRYDQQEVISVARPHLLQIKAAGCKSFVDCTPAWLGRDVLVLQNLSRETGIHIITNTGYYGAAGEKFLPSFVKTKTAEEIAAVWIGESRNGIDNTSVKPGFLKLGVDDLPFTESIQKIIQAAAITHVQTGLPIGIHTSKGGAPATEELRLLESYGVSPKAWIWIHAQNETDLKFHTQLAKRGGWISFDGISKDNTPEYIRRLEALKKENLLRQVLLSQDAGWYNIGTAGGGKFRNYNDFFTDFIPGLSAAGFTKQEIDLMTISNPARAFAISI